LWCVCYLTLGVTLEISKGLDLRKSNTCWVLSSNSSLSFILSEKVFGSVVAVVF
jgi:hypothetical protein